MACRVVPLRIRTTPFHHVASPSLGIQKIITRRFHGLAAWIPTHRSTVFQTKQRSITDRFANQRSLLGTPHLSTRQASSAQPNAKEDVDREWEIWEEDARDEYTWAQNASPVQSKIIRRLGTV